MKKILKNSIYLILIFCFCVFCKPYQAVAFAKNPSLSPASTDIISRESELQEYQAYERDIPTSNSDTHDFFEQTDTPSHNYTVVIDAGHGGLDVK